MDLLDLSNKMDTLAGSIETQTNDAKKNAANAILFELTQTTPVDVGKALSNWQVSLGAPNELVIDAHVPSLKGVYVDGRWTHRVEPDVTRSLNAPPTFDTGEAIIESALPGEAIFITDAVPYIRKLDDGYSDQAPAGFVERATIVARSIIDKFRLKL